MDQLKATFVIVGGGIAGVSCVETLLFLCPDEKIILLTESSIIKTVVNLVPLGKSLTRFDIVEKKANTLKGNLKVIVEQLKSINSKNKYVNTTHGKRIEYKYLCLCTGARPKLIDQANNNPNVLGIRDTESVLEFQKRIKGSRRIVLVGNGGIASEVVYELKNIAIDWIIKDKFISQTFVDPGAAEFFQHRLRNKGNANSGEQTSTIKRMRYAEENIANDAKKPGAALGPDWHRKLDLTGSHKELPSSVKIHTCCQVNSVQSNSKNNTTGYPLTVQLTNNEMIDCDILVSATGVNPQINFQIDEQFQLGTDGGILVDDLMRSSLANVFAAGDCCTAGWTHSDYWFQMRLWTQARQMGLMAGKSMAAALQNEEIYSDFCFELFGHVTQLFGHQVVLLGKYNGQGLGTNYEALIRVTPDKEYIKYVLVDGRLQGAILIGETGLEETSENLILNKLDVSAYGDDLLNPDIDVEDYFD